MPPASSLKTWVIRIKIDLGAEFSLKLALQAETCSLRSAKSAYVQPTGPGGKEAFTV